MRLKLLLAETHTHFKPNDSCSTLEYPTHHSHVEPQVTTNSFMITLRMSCSVDGSMTALAGKVDYHDLGENLGDERYNKERG
jgi:hypothetical protein